MPAVKEGSEFRWLQGGGIQLFAAKAGLGWWWNGGRMVVVVAIGDRPETREKGGWRVAVRTSWQN